MTQILSKTAPAFDTTSTGFRGAASDLGEVLAFLSGGTRPDPEVISRLGISLRSLQAFLVQEAEHQAASETLDQLIRSIDMPKVTLWPEGSTVMFL